MVPSRSRGAPMPPLLPLLLVFVAATAHMTARAFKNDFSSYPEGAQPCLDSSADASGCSGSNFVEMNGCLCANGGNFITDSARCIGRESVDDLVPTYDQLSTNCAGSNDNVTISQAQFVSLGQKAASTTPAPTTIAPTTTPQTTVVGGHTVTVTPTSGADTSGETKDKSLGVGEIVGIAAAGLVGIGAAVAAALLFLRRRRRARASRDESHPMLGQGSAAGPLSPPGQSGSPWDKTGMTTSPSPGPYLSPHHTGATASHQWGYSPHASWAPPPPGYVSPTAYRGPGQVYEMPPNPARGAAPAEMDATQTAMSAAAPPAPPRTAEMDGTPSTPHPYPGGR